MSAFCAAEAAQIDAVAPAFAHADGILPAEARHSLAAVRARIDEVFGLQIAQRLREVAAEDAEQRVLGEEGKIVDVHRSRLQEGERKFRPLHGGAALHAERVEVPVPVGAQAHARPRDGLAVEGERGFRLALIIVRAGIERNAVHHALAHGKPAAGAVADALPGRRGGDAQIIGVFRKQRAVVLDLKVYVGARGISRPGVICRGNFPDGARIPDAARCLEVAVLQHFRIHTFIHRIRGIPVKAGQDLLRRGDPARLLYL